MKKLKYLLLDAIFVWTGMSLQAQSVVSTADNPYWFCLQVQGTSGDGTAGLVVTAEDGDRVKGRPMATDLDGVSKQLWRIEWSSGTNNYAIVNNATGKKLSAIYDAELGARVAVLSDAPSTEWGLNTVSNGKYYFEMKTQPSGGTANTRFLALEKNNDFALTFVSMTSLPSCRYDLVAPAPLLSDDETTIWYNFRSAANGKFLTFDTTTPNIHFLLSDYLETNAATQQWKFVAIPGKTGFVEIVNRASGNKVGTTTRLNHYYYVLYADPSTTTDGWKINALGAGKYELQTVDENGISHYWQATTEGQAANSYVAGDEAAAWVLQWVDNISSPTGIREALPESLRVYVSDRRIIVEGADDYAVYTIMGTRVAKNASLPQGVYLIKIKDTTIKRLVK
jgi:hypothetical protein